jgi:ALTTAQ repeat-containing protein
MDGPFSFAFRRMVMSNRLERLKEAVRLGWCRIDEYLLAVLEEIYLSLTGHTCRAVSATLFFVQQNSQSLKGAIPMNVSVHLTDPPLAASLVEYDGPNATGNIVPSVGPTSFLSSDPTVATVDPVTGNLAYLKAGTTTITGLNSGNGMTASGVLTVISGVAQSASLQFISQAAAAATAPGAVLTAAQVQALTPAQVSALTNVQLAALAPAQIVAWSPAQIAALTPAQLAVLAPAQRTATGR